MSYADIGAFLLVGNNNILLYLRIHVILSPRPNPPSTKTNKYKLKIKKEDCFFYDVGAQP